MSEKINASERYKKEYKYGLKHQAVLQVLNTICRKMVYQSDLVVVLIESGYCGDRSSASRLIKNLKNNKLIMVFDNGTGKTIIQIRKLGILVAENKEDMDKVKNINHKKVNDQEGKLELIQFRLKYFFNRYIVERELSFTEAVDEVLNRASNTFATDTIKTYATIYNFFSDKQVRGEIKKHVQNVQEMDKKRSCSTPNSNEKAPNVTQMNTLDSFARKDIFLTELTKTDDNQLVADVVVFNYALEITPTRMESLKLFREVLKEIGINHTTTTIICKSEVACSTSLRRFKKKDKTSIVTFGYFDKHNLVYTNDRITTREIALKLNEQLEERKVFEAKKRKLREQAEKYSEMNLESVLGNFGLKHWIINNLATDGFEEIIDYVIKYQDDFNRMESDCRKIFIDERGIYNQDFLNSSYIAFLDFMKLNFEALKRGHETYLSLREKYLLNPTKKPENLIAFFDKQNHRLSIRTVE